MLNIRNLLNIGKEIEDLLEKVICKYEDIGVVTALTVETAAYKFAIRCKKTYQELDIRAWTTAVDLTT